MSASMEGGLINPPKLVSGYEAGLKSLASMEGGLINPPKGDGTPGPPVGFRGFNGGGINQSPEVMNTSL